MHNIATTTKTFRITFFRANAVPFNLEDEKQFPAPIFHISKFEEIAERDKITDVYCVFWNLLASILDFAYLNGSRVPGSLTGVSITHVIKRMGIRVHVQIYPGGGFDPKTPIPEVVQFLTQRCQTVFSNCEELFSALQQNTLVNVIHAVPPIATLPSFLVENPNSCKTKRGREGGGEREEEREGEREERGREKELNKQKTKTSAFWNDNKNNGDNNVKTLNCVFAAFPSKRKNLPTVLACFQTVVQRFASNPRLVIRLTIVGGWDMSLVPAELKDSITMLPALSPEALILELSKHDVFLSASTMDKDCLDGFPTTVAMEAMAVGCLLISTNPRGDSSVFRPNEHYIHIPNEHSEEHFVAAIVSCFGKEENGGWFSRNQIRNSGMFVARQFSGMHIAAKKIKAMKMS